MSRGKQKVKPHKDDVSPTEVEAMVEAVEDKEEQTPEQQIAALRDENLRLTAELRNVAQRAQREKQEALKYAEADFAKDLLVVLDDLERTRESARTAEDVQSVAEGVRIIYEHFLKVFREHGIEVIEARDKPFDPDLHEAMMQQPSEDHPTGIVLQEYLRGYKMHGRVIRPTKVVVSSGPPAPAGEQMSKDDRGKDNADV